MLRRFYYILEYINKSSCKEVVCTLVTGTQTQILERLSMSLTSFRVKTPLPNCDLQEKSLVLLDFKAISQCCFQHQEKQFYRIVGCLFWESISMIINHCSWRWWFTLVVWKLCILTKHEMVLSCFMNSVSYRMG